MKRLFTKVASPWMTCLLLDTKLKFCQRAKQALLASITQSPLCPCLLWRMKLGLSQDLQQVLQKQFYRLKMAALLWKRLRKLFRRLTVKMLRQNRACMAQTWKGHLPSANKSHSWLPKLDWEAATISLLLRVMLRTNCHNSAVEMLLSTCQARHLQMYRIHPKSGFPSQCRRIL